MNKEAFHHIVIRKKKKNNWTCLNTSSKIKGKNKYDAFSKFQVVVLVVRFKINFCSLFQENKTIIFLS